MRGAVLHKLGLNLIKERVIRSNYGVVRWRPFKEGKDPKRLKRIDEDGEEYCADVMYWYAKKVSTKIITVNYQGQKMSNGEMMKARFHGTYTPKEYDDDLSSTFTLSICEDSHVPTYRINSGVHFFFEMSSQK